jgi:hypothetical protein
MNPETEAARFLRNNQEAVNSALAVALRMERDGLIADAQRVRDIANAWQKFGDLAQKQVEAEESQP